VITTFPALKLDIKKYPAVEKYLAKFGKKLEQTGEIYRDENGDLQKSRKKTGNKWFETQDQIGYYEDFAKEKIVWGNISYKSQFCFDSKCFLNAPANLLSSDNVSIKYLIAIMNSKLFSWEFEKLGIPLGNAFEWKKQYVENIHIPQISLQEQQPFITIVEQILAITSQPNYNHKLPPEKQLQLESQIDEMVCDLYQLNSEERQLILAHNAISTN